MMGPARKQGRGPAPALRRFGVAPVWWLLGLAAALWLPGCASARFEPAAPMPSHSERAEAVLYLVGDAGDPDSGSRILAFLRADAEARTANSRVAIAFLGDNIYEHGLHEPGHPGREHDLEAIEVQLAVLRGMRAKGVFLSGNHDWGYGGERGLEQVRREVDYVNASAGDDLDVEFLPDGGCPGPSARTLGESVLLVALDTEWLLRYEGEAPDGLACDNPSAADSYRSLAALLAGPEAASRHVIVLAHHPLKTNGPHGGYFGLKDQLFPLTNFWEPLYLPLPFLYPIGRNSGVSSQDMSSPKNRRMRDSLTAAASNAPKPPLAFAAGHEHALQVFRGEGSGADWLLVSGAGSRLRSVEKGDALFAAGRQHGERGYMRLEFFRDGAVLVTVITDGARICPGLEGPDCRPEPAVRYWTWLKQPGGF